MKIGLFYGSSTCYTEMAAEKIREILGEDLVDLHNLKDVSPKLMEDYSILILGIPTWDFGELQEDWEAIWPQLPALDLKGKIVAMYGMGDQLGYGEWFLDALGMLHDQIAPLGRAVRRLLADRRLRVHQPQTAERRRQTFRWPGAR